MASPLNWFRRNAIFIMVPVGIFCMAFFGLGAVFEQFTSNIRNAGTRENPIIATWKGGQFTRDDVNEMQRRHYGAVRLLQAVEQQGREEKGEEFVRLVPPIQPIRDGQEDFVDEQLLSRYLMSEKAKSEGMVVSDSMIDYYLFGTAGGVDLTPRQLTQLNREVNNGAISMAAVRRQLEIELLNQKMVQFSFAGMPRVPNPTESIEHFSKTSRRIECEVVPVSVASYVDDKAKPSDAVLRELYEEGKFEFADPTGERPGFKSPRRVKLQYFVADFNDFLTKATSGLTDQEIQAEYDRLVEQESELVMETVPGDDDSVMPPMNLGEPSSDDADPESDPAPVFGEGVDSGTSDSTDATDASEGNTGEGDTDAPDDSDSSVTVRPQSFQLVSTPLRQETEPAGIEPAGTEPAIEAAVDDVTEAVADVNEAVADVTETVADAAATVDETADAVTESAKETVDEAVEATSSEAMPVEEKAAAEPAASEPAASEPAAAEPAVEKPAATEVAKPETEAPVVEEATAADEAKPADQSADSDNVGGLADMTDAARADADSVGPMMGDDDDKIVKRPRPLKEVADQIRRQLKGQEARIAMTTALKTVESELENYYVQVLQWDDGNSGREKPALPDFQAIADSNGMRLGETALVDNEQLNETEIGSAIEVMFINQRPQAVRLGDKIFDGYTDLREYGAQTANDRDKSYVYWPTELADTQTPAFEDAKDAVIAFWRQREAFNKAKKAAEDLAASANGEKKLSEVAPEKTFQTGEFSWFVARGQRAGFADPIGVDNAGEEFMQTAFGLEQGQAGVASNRTRDTIYVIEPQTEKKPIAEIGQTYLKDNLFKFQRIPPDVGLVNGHYFQEKQMDWNREYVDSMDFDLMK